MLDKVMLYLKLVKMEPFTSSHGHREDLGCVITLVYMTSFLDYDDGKLEKLFDDYQVQFMITDGMEIYSLNTKKTSGHV